ncbi:hypothetical protein [Sphingomonas lacusdianchii]|uniref:hypothetical protein n=1 Tax=Sphingomonas lacusdianchii TaxID=2917992 RepID=UPI001F56287E|nr:hypothetical protein [Sphingomonas sp. JXJ CY 53]
MSKKRSPRTNGRLKANGTRELGQPSSAIPGYGEIDPTQLRSGRIEGDAAAVSAETSTALLGFLRARNVVALLAKTGEQLLREMRPGEISAGPSGLDQVNVEIL